MTFKEKDLFVKILRIYAFQKFLAPFPFKIKKVFNFECQIYKENHVDVATKIWDKSVKAYGPMPISPQILEPLSLKVFECLSCL